MAAQQDTGQPAESVKDVIDFEVPLDAVPGYTEFKVATEEYLSIETTYDWMFEILFILLFTAFFSLIAGLVLRAISQVMTRTKSKWDDIFVHSTRTPLKAIIWILGIYYAANVAFRGQESELVTSLSSVRDVAVVLMIAWALNRFIKSGQKRFIERRVERGESYDYTAINAVGKLLKIAVNISAFLIALQNLGIGIDGVLAFGGISGIAVGFAAKDMLANFFGAFIIYFDKPFKVGDWIRSPDQEIEGDVEDIGWRMTTIRTFDKRPLYVPNSVFANISVENPSRMTNRRIKMHVGVRYDDIKAIKPITTAIREMIEAHEELDTTKTTIVRFDVFNASSCDILVYCFTKTTVWTEYHRVREDVMLKIADIIEQQGAEIAFPTQTLHMIGNQTEDAELERSAKEAKAG